MLVQDVFNQYVIPSIDRKMREMAVLSTRQGNPLTDADERYLTATADSIPTFVKFEHTTANDFINRLREAKDASERFPFIFLDSNGIDYGDDGMVTISQILIATDTDKGWDSDERDNYTVKPILNNMAILLLDSLRSNFGVDSPFAPKMKILYKGTMDDPCTEYVDAIRFSNINLRIINNC